MLTSNYIIFILPLTIILTTFVLFGIFLVINHYGIFFIFNSKASIQLTFGSLSTYLHIFFICSLSFILDYSIKLVNIFFSKSLSSRLILQRALISDRKSFYGINRLFNSKSYSKPNKKKIRKIWTPSYGDKQKSNYFSKSPSKSNNNSIQDNTPKAFNNSKYKVGPDYKNDFFSLRLININKNKNNNDIGIKDINNNESNKNS
jgi:hypothetical protein